MKRKAAADSPPSLSQPEKKSIKQDSKSAPASIPKEHLPATPQTAQSPSMESDDDFGSIRSSDDEMLDDQSGYSDGDSDAGLELGDEDMGFESQDRIAKSENLAYEVNFKVFSPKDIDAAQERLVNEVKDVLGQTPEATAILLRFHRWNKEKLFDAYMEHQEEILEAAGLGDETQYTSRIQKVPGFMCNICCDDDAEMQTFSLKCGHKYCIDCYKTYLNSKIRDEAEAARIKCPGERCNRVVDNKSLQLLISDDLKERYHELLLRTYVDDLESLKWCPAPNCEFAIECKVKEKDLSRIVPTVHCDCSYNFCFGCSLHDHQPAPCSVVRKWMKKCEDDSETANWISANTKECPKCHSTIEKNGGCNHMTCRKCHNEFCWVCMGVWSEHGTSWYNCNRFEEKSGSDARDAQAKSRQSLERYLHYYNRYANHEQSARLDKDMFIKSERKMTLLQSTAQMSWIDVQFLNEASTILQSCRQTLKWTYAFAFYLARNNLTEIFEDNQRDLEMAVENLSEMFEKPPEQVKDLKLQMMDKTAYCKNRRIVLLNDTAENFKKGKWEFIISI